MRVWWLIHLTLNNSLRQRFHIVLSLPWMWSHAGRNKRGSVRYLGLRSGRKLGRFSYKTKFFLSKNTKSKFYFTKSHSQTVVNLQANKCSSIRLLLLLYDPWIARSSILYPNPSFPTRFTTWRPTLHSRNMADGYFDNLLLWEPIISGRKTSP